MLSLRAHAKLNLALSVGPPQPPKGYHPIASWFTAIDLHDTIELARDDRSSCEILWAPDAPKPTPIDWPLEKDLGVRAHSLLEKHVGRALPVRMRMLKRIPVGGGLGGGSSDAAAVLIGLRALFDLDLPLSSLRALSTALGSDIAYFIDDEPTPRPAIVTGFGDRLDRTPRLSGDVLLLIPPFGCPTGPVYAAFDSQPGAGLDEHRVRSLASHPLRSADLFNDLASPACIVEPRLTETLGRLRNAAGPQTPVHVTGSGSTMFALVESAEISAVLARFAAAVPEVRVLPAKLV